MRTFRLFLVIGLCTNSYAWEFKRCDWSGPDGLFCLDGPTDKAFRIRDITFVEHVRQPYNFNGKGCTFSDKFINFSDRSFTAYNRVRFVDNSFGMYSPDGTFFGLLALDGKQSFPEENFLKRDFKKHFPGKQQTAQSYFQEYDRDILPSGTKFCVYNAPGPLSGGRGNTLGIWAKINPQTDLEYGFYAPKVERLVHGMVVR